MALVTLDGNRFASLSSSAWLPKFSELDIQEVVFAGDGDLILVRWEFRRVARPAACRQIESIVDTFRRWPTLRQQWACR